jgi:translation initiation factor eIF-2B subunit delta
LFSWQYEEERMRSEIKSAVSDIRNDRDKGARQLALTALDALRNVADGMPGEELRECARTLALARPMMAAIENAVAWAWSRYLETGDATTAVAEAIEVVETAPEGMAAAARGVLPTQTLMTYSYSSSVAELLSRLKPRRVIVSEARPFNEGLKVARELVAAGISMTLITEAQMALFVQEADAVVVGADMILPDGDFINKIGTRLLALAAKDAGVPFYAASETLKVAAPSQPLPFAPEEGKPKEVCGEKWLEVRNVYFEVTPARLVSGYLTERGLIEPVEIGRYAQEAERRWRALIDSHEG